MSSTTPVVPLIIQDAEALVAAARNAAEDAGATVRSPSWTRAGTSSPSGATTAPC